MRNKEVFWVHRDSVPPGVNFLHPPGLTDTRISQAGMDDIQKKLSRIFWQMRGKVRAFYRHFETPLARMV